MGLRADIYRMDDRDYSNGGISSRCGTVTIVNVDGPDEPSDDAPAVRLAERGGHRCLEALDRPEGWVGPMFGGCYVNIDRRHDLVPLHDRHETVELYASLSA